MISVLIAGAVGLLLTFALTGYVLHLSKRKLQLGQPIREDGPSGHIIKRGTPTMGGVVFILCSIFAYFFAITVVGSAPSPGSILAVCAFAAFGAVGFVDDLLKIKNARSLGLKPWHKIALQTTIGVVFVLIGVHMRNSHGVPGISTRVSFVRDTSIDFAALGAFLGLAGLLIWISLIFIGSSNAVNIADGLDGLATGASIFAFVGYVFIGYWQFNQSCFSKRLDPAVASACYISHSPLEVAIFASAIAGSLIGFLWWNTSPAKIFMGDTGSLALGAALAICAIFTRTELLLPILAGIFVADTGSVILQRLYFRFTGGKRIFLMSPIHHHFELKGWAEQNVVVRFWLIAGLFSLSSIGIFYAHWSFLAGLP